MPLKVLHAIARQALGLARASHPFPAALVVVCSGVVGLASSEGGVEAGRLGAAVAAMLGSQLATGWTNDFIDRDADARFQPAKPVPAGEIGARFLPPASLVAIAVAFGLGAWLGPLPLAFLVGGTAAALAYNLGLKDTGISWAPFVAGFALLPPFVWSATDTFRGDFVWLYAMASPLALAAHLANGLPDVETDLRAGRTGLSVTLGREMARLVVAGSMLTSPLLAIAAALWVDYDLELLAPALAAYALIAPAGLLALSRSDDRSRQVAGFRLVGLAGVILAGGWLAGV